MENDDDFTFCQVGAPAPQDAFGAENHDSNIGTNAESGRSNGSDSGQTSSILWKDGVSNNATPKKEETIGSLSFNVIDASSLAKPNDLPAKVASLDVGTKVQKNSPAKKPAARAKVPFEKGYSQMDWLKLTRTHPDLAGLNGQPNTRRIKMSEVKQHNLEGYMWTVLKGRVYNLSPYMKFHPGGVDMLMKAVAKDCTSLFNKYHAWVNEEFLLEKCLVGVLDDAP